MCFTKIARRLREAKELGHEIRIKPRRELVQHILSMEFEEPASNFHQVADRIVRELEDFV